MNIFHQILLFLTICLLCNSCEFFGIEKDVYDEEITLRFENQSKEDIYIIAWSAKSTYDFSPNMFYNHLPSKIEIKSGSFYHDKSSFKRYLYFNDLQILVFKQSTLDSYSEEEIIRDNIYDTRYVLTRDDLIDKTFRIIYTGDV